MTTYTSFLVNNIPLSATRLIPKEMSNIIKQYVFGDKVYIMQRKHFEQTMKTIQNKQTFLKSCMRIQWYYDEENNNFVSSSIIVSICIQYSKNVYAVSMHLIMCDYCGNYKECDSIEKEDIPLHIKCNC